MKEYYIVFNNIPRGAFSVQDLQSQTIMPDTLIWKEGWPDWLSASAAAQSHPELQAIMGEALFLPENEQQAASLSTVDRLYQRIGDWIDRRIQRNQHQLDSHLFYRLLHRWRERYLQLPPGKQSSFRLLLSSLLLLVSFWLVFSSFSWGWSAAMMWIAFVALNEILAISHILDEVTHAGIRYVLTFIPRFLKRFIARHSKTTVTLIIAYWLSSIIAPFYFLYHLILLLFPVRTVEQPHSDSSN